MKNHILRLFFVSQSILLALLLNACNTYNHVIHNKDQLMKEQGYPSGKMPFHMHSSDLDAPFFSEKGEVYLNGSVGNAIGLGAGYALSGKTFLRARYSQYDKITEADGITAWMDMEYDKVINDTVTHVIEEGYYSFSKDLDIHSRSLEVAFGLSQKMKNNFMNEVSLGVAGGKIKNTYAYSIGGDHRDFTETRKYFQLTLQDDIGWLKKNFETSLTGRFNSYFFTDRNFEMAIEHEVPDYQTTAFSLEGALRVAFGWKFLKPYLEIVATLPVASPEIEWEPYMVKGGLIARF